MKAFLSSTKWAAEMERMGERNKMSWDFHDEFYPPTPPLPPRKTVAAVAAPR